jgi:tRNA-uridine 2-sulfurtransferase
MSARILVALSGGVDSAVAAWLLKSQGQDVEGLHMTNWVEDEDGYCTAAEDWEAAQTVGAALGIPVHRVSFAAEYRERVFNHFLEDYAAGRTPNPDVLCNREVKFGVCLAYAERLGATHLATGHYARIGQASDGPTLKRARDASKDQSYFLQQMPREALAKALFPLGDYLKSEVRAMARAAGLPVHDRPDSTGICFIGERPFREFLSQYLKTLPGPILTPEGTVLGSHEGLCYHTIGQRQGLKIGGQRQGSGRPWYVAAKDPARNALIVVQGEDHPLLTTREFVTESVVWFEAPENPELECEVQIRHRQAAIPARVRWAPDGAEVSVFRPLRGVAPGQYAAFYDADRCLGGGVIRHARAGSRAV